MSKPAVKKSAVFKKLLPFIEQKLEEGYTYDGVVEILKAECDLELTENTFKNYLSRYRKEVSAPQNNIIIETKQTELIPQLSETEKLESDSSDDDVDLDKIQALLKIQKEQKGRISILEKGK